MLHSGSTEISRTLSFPLGNIGSPVRGALDEKAGNHSRRFKGNAEDIGCPKHTEGCTVWTWGCQGKKKVAQRGGVL